MLPSNKSDQRSPMHVCPTLNLECKLLRGDKRRTNSSTVRSQNYLAVASDKCDRESVSQETHKKEVPQSTNKEHATMIY